MTYEPVDIVALMEEEHVYGYPELSEWRDALVAELERRVTASSTDQEALGYFNALRLVLGKPV